MSTRLARRRTVRLGPLQLTVTMEERTAQRLRDSAPGRVIRRRLASSARNGHTSVASTEAPGAQIVVTGNGAPHAGANGILDRLAPIDWYHVMELPGGVITPGRADHRAELSLYGLPEDMRGMRALDVATFDGFWAFEMERRGADMTAIDIPSWSHLDLPLRWREGMKSEQDAPTGAGFRLAAELLRSNVTRREQSVYDLSPEEIGQFDLVFISDLLQHLRDPQRALERVYSVTKPGGTLLLAEEYAPRLEKFVDAALVQFRAYDRYTWWVPSTAALRVMLRVAGFDTVEEVSRIGLNYDREYNSQKVVLRARRA